MMDWWEKNGYDFWDVAKTAARATVEEKKWSPDAGDYGGVKIEDNPNITFLTFQLSK